MRLAESHGRSRRNGDQFIGPAGIQTRIFLSVVKSQYQLRYEGS